MSDGKGKLSRCLKKGFPGLAGIIKCLPDGMDKISEKVDFSEKQGVRFLLA